MRMKPPSFLVSSGLLSDPQLCGRSGAHAAALRWGIAAAEIRAGISFA